MGFYCRKFFICESYVPFVMFFVIFFVFSFSHNGFAQLRVINQIPTPNMTMDAGETAYGHLPGRLYLSMGARRTQNLDNNLVPNTAHNHLNRLEQMLWLNTGIVYPLSAGVGLNLSTSSVQEELKPVLYSAYLQYNIFQQFMLPTVSMRGQISRSSEYHVLDSETVSLQPLVSWGYGPVVATLSMTYNRNKYRLKGANEYQVGEQTFLSQHVSLHINILPGFLTVSATQDWYRLSRKNLLKATFEF